MSGLTGIWNLDGEPVSRQVLSRMSAQLSHRGPDGENLLVTENVGFAFQTLHVTPESPTEIQPLRHQSGPILVWDGRLDNREELAASIPQWKGPNDAPDSTLVLEAYLAFGNEFLSRLDGDFALALFDPKQQEMLLARDRMGGRTLYHCRFRHHFLFATEIKALLAHPSVQTAPNVEATAEWLYRIPDFSDLTRTFFKDISTVPAGHVFRLTPRGQSLARFWDFDLGKELRLKHHSDYVDAYRDAFSKAVKKRMRSAFPIAFSVSGGLDSSSVYCMAEELNKTQAGPALIGVGLVPDDPQSNEWEYQSAIEDRYRINLHKVPIVGANMVNRGERKPAWYSEGPYLKWDAWGEILRIATEQDARVVLSGVFGDNILTNPQYILDLAARGRIITAAQHLAKYFEWWEGISRRHKVNQLYLEIKGFLVPEWIRPTYHRIRRKAGLDPKEYIPWYSDKLTSAANRLKDRVRPMDLPPCRAHVKIIGRYLYSRLLEVKLDMEAKIDSGFQCDSAHPFRDRDLVALVMSMPGEVVYHAGSRGIHREAMKGILPESIRLRKTKASFMEPVRVGAIQDFDIVGGGLVHGTSAKLGYLADNPLLEKSLEALRPSLETCEDAVLPWLMNDLVGLEAWLSAFFSSSHSTAEV